MAEDDRGREPEEYVDRGKGLMASIAAATDKEGTAYLGDYEMVSILVTGFLNLVLTKLDEKTEGAEASQVLAAIDAEIERMTRIFLGQDAGYAKLAGWNDPSGDLPMTLAKLFKYSGTGDEIVKAVLKRAQGDISSAYGMPDKESAAFMVEQVQEFYTGIFHHGDIEDTLDRQPN